MRSVVLDEFFGDAHECSGDGKAENDDTEESVNWKNERSKRLTTEWKQEWQQANQPLRQKRKQQHTIATIVSIR